MAALSPSAASAEPPRPAPRPAQQSPAEQELLGLWGLLIGGGGSLTAVMADSDGTLRARAVTLLVLVSVVGYLMVRQYARWPAGPTGMISGVLFGLIVGWLVASTVLLVGPSLIIPLGLAVTTVAALSWLIHSVRQASVIIGQTVAELETADLTGSDANPDLRA